MKTIDLELYGVQELSTRESQEINGGTASVCQSKLPRSEPNQLLKQLKQQLSKMRFPSKRKNRAAK